MIDRQWHYAAGGTSVGPRTTHQMQALIGAGEVTAQTLVWREGMAEWAEAAATELRGLFAEKVATPPPAPPAALPAGFGATFASAGGAAPWMGFGEAVRSCLTNYATFSGRASRSQYWFFTLFLTAVNIGITLIDIATGATVEPIGAGRMVLMAVSLLFALGMFIPSLAVTSRRFHDAGWSFWWFLLILVPLAGLVFVFVVSLLRDPNPNRFDAP